MLVAPLAAEQQVTYEVLTELSAIEEIAREWGKVLELSNCNRAFGSAAWVAGFCRHDPDISPWVTVAWKGGQLAGVLPLVLHEKNWVVSFAPSFTDYNDIVACPGDAEVPAGLLLHAASGEYKLILNFIRQDSDCYRAAQTLWPAAAKNFLPQRDCLYIRLNSCYEDYLASLSPRFRRKLKQAERKAAENGLVVKELTPGSFAPRILPEIFLGMHLERFGEVSAFAAGEARSFVREVFPTLFERRWLRAFAVQDQNRIIALDICLAGAGSLCLWNRGFLPEAAPWSPGKLLLAEEIRQAFAEGSVEFDLLRGVQDYKTHWATYQRSVGRLEI